MTEREEALYAAYESLSTRLCNASYNVFLELARGWEVYPLKVNKKIIGALLIDGPEIHACVKPEGFKRWINKAVLAKIQSLIDKHGFALTKVTEDNTTGIEFVERLGFRFNTVWNNTIIYIKG
jgi:ribosomal protein S18 acetylase RimI-like enzyme